MRIRESTLRRIIREEATRLAENVDHDSVIRTLKQFRLPRLNRSMFEEYREPTRVRVLESMQSVQYNVDFRRWGSWSAPYGVDFDDYDRHEIDRDDLDRAREAWSAFVSRQSWSALAENVRVDPGEKQYLYCTVGIDLSDVSGFDGRDDIRLR